MIKTGFALLFVLLTLVAFQPANAQTGQEKLMLDPLVRTGKLPNGMTYYIRKNTKPENRAELRLAVNAGSLMEDESQLGLAHFCEHMCFNGTKNFTKSALVDYLESIGTKFGADLNAYTSFDETVYMLQLPTDKKDVLDKGFLVLEDWASNVSFDNEEIDKERGVVIEEWRLGKGADARMRDRYFPVLLKDSKYADRLPIGKKEILENFKYDEVKRFYKDWYRPDLMAVIAVGDFNPDEVETMIKAHFSGIKNPASEKKREIFGIPDHKDILVAIEKDKEAQYNLVQLYYKHNKHEDITVNDYRERIVEELYSSMLSKRLEELKSQANPPFLFAVAQYGEFLREKEAYINVSVAPDGGIERALETMVTENERVRRHGFTSTELERSKVELLKQIEKSFNEKDKTDSKSFVSELVQHFLSADPVPGIEKELEYYKSLMPGITLEEINKKASIWIRKDNTVVVLTGPDKEGAVMPTKEKVLQIMSDISQADIKPYQDNFSSEPLLAQKPVKGSIIEENVNNDLGITTYKLSNGVQVILKTTTFKNDEVLMTAFSPGGTAQYPESKDLSAGMAASIIDESGIGVFDKNKLQKKLSGKLVSLTPYISEQREGLTGESTPEDMSTLMKLVYLYFTSPRRDSIAYEGLMTQMKTLVINKGKSPEANFQDTIEATLAQYHPRRIPLNMERMGKINFNDAWEIYNERFSDASDFTFIFVGNISSEELKPLLETYIASLPAKNRKETPKDLGVKSPDKVVVKEIKKGIEPKSMVSVVFAGPMEWTQQNRFDLDVMIRVLSIKLRENLREDKGGVYGVRANASVEKYPKPSYRVNIGFGCAPENVETLTKAVFDEIAKLSKDGAQDKELQKVKETVLRERELQLKENDFWLSWLERCAWTQDDPAILFNYNKLVEGMNATSIQKTAASFLKTDRHVQVVMNPETK